MTISLFLLGNTATMGTTLTWDWMLFTSVPLWKFSGYRSLKLNPVPSAMSSFIFTPFVRSFLKVKRSRSCKVVFIYLVVVV